MLAAVLLLGLVALARAQCPTTIQSVEDGCSLPKGLEITSKPKGIVLNGDSCNTTYPKGEWQEEPKVVFADAEPDAKYAVFLVDPDAINTPPGKNYWHWFAANVPGGELKTGNWANDYSLLKYRGPAPPKGTGVHRYQFVLFKFEDPSKEIKLQLSNDNRPKFDLGNFIDSVKDMAVLCGPIAGLQFRAEF